MSDTEWDSINANELAGKLDKDIEAVRDNWDDDDDDEEEIQEVSTIEKINPKTGSSLKMETSTKAKLNKIDITSQLIQSSSIPKSKLTSGELLEEKLRLQKIQENEDLELAKELFGGTASSSSKLSNHSPNLPHDNHHNVANIDFSTVLQNIINLPKNTREEFDELATSIKTLLKSVKDSPHFHYLAEEIIRFVCQQVSPVEVKKLSILMDAISQEKLKSKTKKNQPVQPTTKGKKPTLKKTSEKDYDSYMPPDDDDFDMF